MASSKSASMALFACHIEWVASIWNHIFKLHYVHIHMCKRRQNIASFPGEEAFDSERFKCCPAHAAKRNFAN